MIRFRDNATVVCLLAIAFAVSRAQDEEPQQSELTPTKIVEVPAMGIALPAKCVSVHDGDTLKVEVRLTMDVRLLDCWAPELHGPERLAGFASRDHLKELAEGKAGTVFIPLTSDNIGKATSMGRVLGRFIVNGDDVSYEQVKAKHATKTKPKDNRE